MSSFLTRRGPALALFAALAALAAGCGHTAKCGHSASCGTTTAAGVKEAAKGVPVARADDKKAVEPDGWWCDEHGLPESVCDQCSRKYREAEKAKGNWCAHNRVKTSCFKCNPGLKERYAAEYKAKYGKAPPPTEDDEKK